MGRLHIIHKIIEVRGTNMGKIRKVSNHFVPDPFSTYLIILKYFGKQLELWLDSVAGKA